MWVVIDGDVGLGLNSENGAARARLAMTLTRLVARTFALGNIPLTNTGNKLAITSADHETVALIELIVFRI